MAKKEKLIDLKSKPETITKEQLKKVQDIINGLNRAQLELGVMETRKHSLLHSIAGIQDELTLMQDEFEKQYGTNNINIQTGEIKYPKENGQVNKKN
tara:strand:- start:18 stop:308 length:291 start_codon:yes stop_codon:yes gene_type:complete